MPSAEISGDVIAVETRWTDKDLVKLIPGSRWDPDLKLWTLPLTWAACVQLRGVFRDNLTVGPELEAWSWREYRGRVETATTLRATTTRVDIPGLPARLYDFQTGGVAFMVAASAPALPEPGGALLADDMGLGKTPQTLLTLQHLGDDALPALVFCPNSVKTGWERQAHLWQVDVNVYVVAGGAAQRRRIIEDARADPRALVVLNIESARLFSRLAPYGSVRLARCRECDRKHGDEKITASRCEVHPKELNGFGFRTVILDEAHRIKDPQSKQTRAVWAVAHDPSVRYRWPLTGTPVAEHVGDLWSIMHFMAPREFPSKTKFIDRYALQSWNAYGGLDIVGINPEHRDEFYRILDSRFRRTPKALVLTQLPRVVRPTRWVDMVPKQARAYAELSARLATRLETGEVLVSPNNLVNSTRLLQLASSYAEVEWVRNPLHVTHKCRCYAAGLDEHAEDCLLHWKIIVTLAEPSPKLDAMEEAFDELGGKPLVVAAMSRQLIDLAAARFKRRGVPHGLITGPVSEYERQNVLRRFQGNEINVVLMTVAAGGTGVDGLQHADTMFCLQRPWSMIENLQVDGRVDRIGSEKHSSVTIVDFVTRGTIEETDLYPRLVAKYERLEEINRDRARLTEAGIEPARLFELDRVESLIHDSNLAAPLTSAERTSPDWADLTELARRYGIADEPNARKATP